MSRYSYLYWHIRGELKHICGDDKTIIETCAYAGAQKYYCYDETYQFKHPWFILNRQYGVLDIIPAEKVPGDIQALHLLLFRGNHG